MYTYIYIYIYTYIYIYIYIYIHIYIYISRYIHISVCVCVCCNCCIPCKIPAKPYIVDAYLIFIYIYISIYIITVATVRTPINLPPQCSSESLNRMHRYAPWNPPSGRRNTGAKREAFVRRQPPNLANHTLPPKRATIIPRKRPINYLLCIYIYIENVGPGGGVDHIYIYIYIYIYIHTLTMDCMI